MKPGFTFLSIVLMTCVWITLSAQNSPEDVEIISSTNIKEPKFPGGNGALKEYIHNNLDDQLLEEVDAQGQVFVKFPLDKKGRPGDIEVVPDRTTVKNEKVLEDCKRVMANMPWWAPAREGEKKIRVTMSYSIKID